MTRLTMVPVLGLMLSLSTVHAQTRDTVVFSGGCFWGVQAVFAHIRGVESATSGYAGGERRTAEYQIVSTGRTGHAESVQVVFDPSQVSFDQLLDVFFKVVHDPTQRNRQGPDVGTQYRSAIWFTSRVQEREARHAISVLTREHYFSRPIVTEVAPLDGFFPAEDYHQDYYFAHPNQPYIVINDRPKVAQLHHDFPDLWRDDAVRWHAAATRD